MPSDERRPDEAKPEPEPEPVPDRPPPAAPAGERLYDSFVVRLWREVGNRRLLRVEVEHTQSDRVANARGVEVDWIGARIAELLGEPRGPPRDRVTEGMGRR